MEYMYLVSSPSVYLLGAARPPISSYTAENPAFSTHRSTNNDSIDIDSLIRKKGCNKEMSTSTKTDRKSLKRKTRRKAKRNHSHNESNGSSTVETSRTLLPGCNINNETEEGRAKAVSCNKPQKKSRGQAAAEKKSGADRNSNVEFERKDEGLPVIQRQGIGMNHIRPDDLLNLCDSLVLSSHPAGLTDDSVAVASRFNPRKSHVHRPMLKLGDSRKQLRQSSKCSSTLSTKTGKENCYSVWQRVQRNDKEVSELDTERGSICSKLRLTWKEDASSARNPFTVSKVSTSSRTEDTRQSKDKTSKKSKRKTSHFKEEICNCCGSLGSCQHKLGFNSYEKSSSTQQTGTLGVFNHMNDQNMVKGVPRISYKNNYPGSRFRTLGVEYVDSEPEFNDQRVALDSLNQNELNKAYQTTKEAEIEEFNKQSHGSGSTLQKWVPVGIREPELSNSAGFKKLNLNVEVTNVEAVASDFLDLVSTSPTLDVDSPSGDDISHGDECVEETTNPDDSKPEEVNQDVANPSLTIPSSFQQLASFEVRLEGTILQAVNDTLKVQLASEAIEVATGCPVAEFERLLHSSSPSVPQSTSLLTCQACSLDQTCQMPLSRNDLPNISLRSLWEWYETHGIYGLEVRAEDHKNSSRLGVDQLSFRAYFVPFLSAIQLFSGENEGRKAIRNNDSIHRVSETSTVEEGEEKSGDMILPVLAAKATDKTWTDDVTLLFEYFESERPQLRQPLYEKIHELARGDGLTGRKTFGDPSTLVSMNLAELHKKSWYSVAWYPIYKIPDGSLRAAFLTYHSFGHLVERRAEFGSPTVVCPVVGLQSYNAQDECWFQPRHSATDHQTEEGMTEPCQVLNERLRTLQETACCMARATVKKGNEESATNWHPDYEFFLSRQLF